ncbi:MAG: RagB/SusD family nutrient uptake outer membrane protein [Bacteroidota bacterium]|nr:RagB/SusD family nutrient uptake outer membrane protein [Bacteroidota bacterium]
MKNRNKKYKLSFIAGVIILALTLGSCESYLDKAPESSITEKDAFGNFVSFQGFVEEMYNCITDYSETQSWFLFADEVLTNQPFAFDQGDYWAQSGLLYGTTASTDLNNFNKRVWPLCWYGIRKANLALSKLDLLVDATQEEKDLIKGQALFFRGWFYFELMRYWGGLPYIDTVLSSTDELAIPRLNYRETALKAAKDLKDAAALLPVKWDDTEAGKRTLGNNRQRISKVMALAYLGKDLLFAASPMMNEESTGKASFDADLCKQSAEAFADAIKICDETGAYRLQSWDTWTDNFWVWTPGWHNKMPGGTEVIMNTTVFLSYRVTSVMVGRFTPVEMGLLAPMTEVPTNNYVKNYGMANGLPIDDPLSGYDPNDPWTNREPRFYKDIIIDGDELAATTAAGPDRYAQLYNGGRHKGGKQGSVTGYYFKRWSPKGCNKWENKQNNFQSYVPYMRLADVYLMYAEAVLQGFGTAQSKVPGSITAEQAVNVIRNRAQLPSLTGSYAATKDRFMETIIRERAVELAFDTNRFHDLRRWNISGETKYKEKTAIDFDRGPNGKPIYINDRVVVTRVFEKKHNWLPFQVSFTKLYKDFPQNPGW